MTKHEPYTLLAPFYDGAWSEYSEYVAELIERLAHESRRTFRRVCDAACGTGMLLRCIQDESRTLYGYDRSERMIEFARLNVPSAHLAVGDLTAKPPFDGPFDLITCVYDSLNYLLDESALATFFAEARGAIAASGVMVIDLNDAAMYLGRDGQVHHRLIDGVGIRERLEFNPEHPALARTVFEFPNGVEEHVQRVWNVEEVEALLESNGWNVLDTMDVMDADHDERSGKVVYIAVPRM